jgi:hypothetical protein
MDIFKLFFDHDKPLDTLTSHNNDELKKKTDSSFEDFLSPTSTYSRFYLMGTRPDEEKFGLNQLEKFDQILDGLNAVFDGFSIYSSIGMKAHLSDNIKQLPPDSAIILSEEKELDVSAELNQLISGGDLNKTHHQKELQDLLFEDCRLLFKERARDGYDLQLFSKENIYPKLFYPFQKLVDDSFRFFSVNSKRMRSEKHFYFETWTLDRPPHGAEEVFGDTVLRSKK